MTSPPRNPRTVTLADVARYAGVSTAVVSYVVNDGPRPVAAGTAVRVRDAISVLGYRPNSHARALRSGTTKILGLVHPGTSNPFFGEYLDVLYDAATRAGLALLTGSSAGDAASEQRLIEDLAARSVDGILAVTSMNSSDISALRHPGLPFTLLNCPFPVAGVRTLGPDARRGARRVVDHLITGHGHRDVALIAGETGSSEPDDRERGWTEALLGVGVRDGRAVRAAFTLDGGYQAARALVTSDRPPAAVFASSDLQAVGALHALHDQGLRVPQDVAVVSFDGTRQAAHSWPPLTLVRQPLYEMADAAITSVTSGAAPTHTLFDMELVVRESCGCPPVIGAAASPPC